LIYSSRPSSCRLWSCVWLIDPDATRDLYRPDRSHYVIDMMPDYIGIHYNDSGDVQNIPVVQIWVAPKFPTAHRDPALRQYLIETEQIAVIRYGSRSGMLLVPPSKPGEEWIERREQPQDSWVEHSHEDLIAVLTGARQDDKPI
jgi:hypothetical protein